MCGNAYNAGRAVRRVGPKPLRNGRRNMFCPNCGASNDKKQNYCRTCGLSLRAAAKSLADQIVFGEESDSVKKLSSAKRFVEIASVVVLGALLVGASAYLFFIDAKFGMGLVKVSLVVFFGLKAVQEVIGYFLRKARRNNRRPEPAADPKLEGAPTAKLIEDRTFEPAQSVVEEPTALLHAEKSTARF